MMEASILDSDRLLTELGWEPTIPFDHGLSDTVSWYANNRDWWEPLRGRAPVTEEAAWSAQP